VKYVALIYTDDTEWAALADDERAAVYERYEALATEGQATGVVLGGAELQPADTATTVRVRDGRTQITDGPYAEVKEALGGYFLLECASIDEAAAWAARIPGAETGAVEVRALHVDEEVSA